jgi:tRNA U38,U39,U40 pseudouridine synthase TruA
MHVRRNMQVNKRFNARHACIERTYEYYLPASLLGKEPASSCHLDWNGLRSTGRDTASG